MIFKIIIISCLFVGFSFNVFAIDLPDFRTRSGSKMDKSQLLQEMNNSFQLERNRMLDYMKLKLKTEQDALKYLGISSFDYDYQFVDPIDIIEIKSDDFGNTVLEIKCNVKISNSKTIMVNVVKLISRTIVINHITSGKGPCKGWFGLPKSYGTCRVEYDEKQAFWELRTITPLNIEL